MILDNCSNFLEELLENINKLGVDVSDLDMDHIAYQASSNEDYDRLTKDFEKIGKKVSEEIVNGRRVGIYQLNEPVHFKQYSPYAIELIAPKTEQNCKSALEHVEFVLKDSFDSFLKRYPNLPWDTIAINQPMFPMIRLKLTDTTQVKFHLKTVLDIVASK